MSEKTYTAAELAGDWWWMEQGYVAQTRGGRTHYEEVTAAPNTIRLSYLLPTSGGGLRQVNRYVAPETQMRLVRP